MEDDKSITVRILRKLIEDVDGFVESPRGQARHKTRVDFIEDAIREKLEEYNKKRFEHFNFHENIIRVLDNEIGKNGDIVELRKKGSDLHCGHDESKNCIHIKFVWSDPELVKIFKKAGLGNPF